MSVAALPGETEKKQHGLKTKKNVSKFNHSRYVAPNSPAHSPFNSICSVMQQRVYGTLFKKINELMKTLVEV